MLKPQDRTRRCNLSNIDGTTPHCLVNTDRNVNPMGHGLSRYLETGCPNRGFIDFCVSKVWYKIHTTNKIDPIPLQILLF